jgi:hypothetical protein
MTAILTDDLTERKQFTCKSCGIGYTNPRALGTHYDELPGHRTAPTLTKTPTNGTTTPATTKRTYTRKPKTTTTTTGAEIDVIATCATAFETANLADGERQRILNYLCARFLPDED